MYSYYYIYIYIHTYVCIYIYIYIYCLETWSLRDSNDSPPAANPNQYAHSSLVPENQTKDWRRLICTITFAGSHSWQADSKVPGGADPERRCLNCQFFLEIIQVEFRISQPVATPGLYPLPRQSALQSPEEFQIRNIGLV